MLMTFNWSDAWEGFGVGLLTIVGLILFMGIILGLVEVSLWLSDRWGTWAAIAFIIAFFLITFALIAGFVSPTWS